MKIRIAVAVDENGRWEAQGNDGATDSECCGRTLRTLRSFTEREPQVTQHVVFVEADVPLPPEPVVIEGTVTE